MSTEVQPGQAVAPRAVFNAMHQGRPDALMHERDRPGDKPTHEDFGRRPDGTRHLEDTLALGVRPPAAVNRFAGEGFGERRQGPGRRLHDHAVAPDEGDGLLWRHNNPRAIQKLS